MGERADGRIPILRPIDPHCWVTEGRPGFGVGGLVPRACAEVHGMCKLSFGAIGQAARCCDRCHGAPGGRAQAPGGGRLCVASSLGKGMGSKNGGGEDTTAATEEWVSGWVRRLRECI